MAEETERRANSFRALADAMGISVSRVHALSKEDWFPKRGDGWWVVDDCLGALARHRRGDPPASAFGRAEIPSSTNPLIAARAREDEPSVSTAEPEDRKVLSEARDPLDVARAAMRLASRRLADAGPKESSRALEDVKRSVEELRRTEEGYVKLALQRGELVERSVAKAVIGAFGRRFVLALERLESRVASQVELWIADPAFVAATVDERGNVVYAWVKRQTSQARLAETEEGAREAIEQLVANEIADRESGT